MDTQALQSGSINFSGLGSGTDFASMVEKLVQLERRRVARLELWKSEWEAKQVGFRDLNTKLLTMRTKLQGMDTMSKFMVKNAVSTNAAVLTATADDKAQVGVHVIEVNQLAQTHILTGKNGVASAKTDITANSSRTFVYKYPESAKTNITLEVPKDTSLEGLRNMINTDPKNPGVRASIVKVDEGDYRLQLRGMDLGQGKVVTVVSSDIPGLEQDDFDTTQAARNARLKVDGFPLDDPDDPEGRQNWIERPTNSINDLIDGLTLTLNGTGTVNLNTNVDEEAVKENVREFVNQVNEVRAKIKELTQVVGESQGSILTGNYGIQMIDSRLKSIVSVKGLGFDLNNDVFSSLGMVGISTDVEQGSPTFGLLKLDEDALDNALKNRPDALARIFAADYIGSSDSGNFRYYSSIDGITKGGDYAVRYETDGTKIISATINGRAATVNGDEITGTYGFPEAGMIIKVDNLEAGRYEGNVFLKQGKAAELAMALKDLTGKETGPLIILEENYDDIIDGIDRKIEFEERRVQRFEKDMRNRFARLEALLGYYDSLGKSLNSQITQLRADNK